MRGSNTGPGLMTGERRSEDPAPLAQYKMLFGNLLVRESVE